jgi:hypothetical protein
MPQDSELFQCAVTPSDELVSYTTDMEQPQHALLFALVMTNEQKQKISVLLTKEDALRLRAQLDTFIIQCAIARS